MLIKSKDERLWHTLGAHAMTGHQNSYGSLCGKRYEGRVDMVGSAQGQSVSAV